MPGAVIRVLVPAAARLATSRGLLMAADVSADDQDVALVFLEDRIRAAKVRRAPGVVRAPLLRLAFAEGGSGLALRFSRLLGRDGRPVDPAGAAGTRLMPCYAKHPSVPRPKTYIYRQVRETFPAGTPARDRGRWRPVARLIWEEFRGKLSDAAISSRVHGTLDLTPGNLYEQKRRAPVRKDFRSLRQMNRLSFEQESGNHLVDSVEPAGECECVCVEVETEAPVWLGADEMFVSTGR